MSFIIYNTKNNFARHPQDQYIKSRIVGSRNIKFPIILLIGSMKNNIFDIHK